ncbi:histidinol-phosphatase HisJ [Viridibacillus sp. YIM B01967]|uniref:Histidinol-phosphatase n=1 Tax=Viridibacillus soli TaxID=2798301 RepID=A0ABS1H2F9_9BACL|nr:histidinol-phosphatase HisJ [Viridibacillus soli]MBK3493600.1 histidinol-phosphatase HisJ [Viridibacillus soli]
MKRDAHIHSPFCPHGTTDAFEDYIKKAIACGFTDITFTEHAPLPIDFTDPTPLQDSGMKTEYLTPYIQQLTALKIQYAPEIRIRIGLEVDYIIGYERQTRDFLNDIGPQLDDAILSVHFLKYDNTYTCIDYSSETFLEFAELVGSVKKVYNLYYDTVKESISADLGPYKPKRIGHPTLIHKFQLAHPQKIEDNMQIEEVLHHIANEGYELDLNSAGLSKKDCKEPYPPLQYVKLANDLKIPLVFGSDAHQVADLHRHYNKIFPLK